MDTSSPADDARAQRGSSFGLFPLAVIALTFFVPSVRACDQAESAASFLRDSPATAPFVLAPYLAATLVCVATAMAIRAASATSPSLRWTLYASLFILFGGNVAAIVAFAVQPNSPRIALAWSVVAASAGLVAIVRAARAAGFWSWVLFLAAFAAFLAGHPISLLLLSTWFEKPGDLLGGGYLFLGAWIVLVAILGWTLAGAPRSRAT